MKTNSIEKSFTIGKFWRSIFRILIFHERVQKVYHEHFSVVYTMKLSWNTYFMKFPERHISQCILALILLLLFQLRYTFTAPWMLSKYSIKTQNQTLNFCWFLPFLNLGMHWLNITKYKNNLKLSIQGKLLFWFRSFIY